MLTCPKCHFGIPDGMRFCLQCGSSLAPSAPSQSLPARTGPPPQAPNREVPTVPLKIAPTPVMSPRSGAGAAYPRPSFRDDKLELDEEALKKSFERQVTHPGAIVCRFCKGPLDLSGDFCEQCGAPVMEAAPPGTVTPKPAPPPPPPPAAPAPIQSKPVQPAPPPRPPDLSATGMFSDSASPQSPRPAARPTPARGPASVAPVPPPRPRLRNNPRG